jgi:tetratricopeptide (TPR) repeat protein
MPEARDDDPKGSPFDRFRIEIDPGQVEDAVRRLRERLRASFEAGRYTKVRLSYQGKQLGPDIPLAVFLAGEGAVFWIASPLAALLVNLGAKAFLDVEILHEADELVREGLDLYLRAEPEAAEAKYREALTKRPEDPAALYNLAVLLRVTGRADEALACLRRAAMGPEGHPDVQKAAELIERMSSPKKTL